MLKAREHQLFDAVAWLCLYSGAGVWSKKRLRLEDVHPLYFRSREVNISQLVANHRELAKHLPKKLSPAEKRAAWKRISSRLDAQERESRASKRRKHRTG